MRVDLLRGGMAIVERTHVFVQALNAHLTLVQPMRRSAAKWVGRYALGPCFYHCKPYYAVLPVDIDIVLGFELFPRCLCHWATDAHAAFSP